MFFGKEAKRSAWFERGRFKASVLVSKLSLGEVKQEPYVGWVGLGLHQIIGLSGGKMWGPSSGHTPSVSHFGCIIF